MLFTNKFVLIKKRMIIVQTDDYSPDWHWGVYPSEEGLKQQINNATVIIATDNDKVIELCRSC